MARRSGRTSLANSVHFSTPEQSAPLPQSTTFSDDLVTLRTHWKWAAFTQFITTFSSLLNMADVTVNGVENDLVSGSRRVIPRVMQRLLYTLTYDRKISVENWQSALRKQYMKRDPLSNPLGPEPPRELKTESREPTPDNPDGGDAQNHSVQDALGDSSNQHSEETQSQAGPSRTTSNNSRATTQEFEEGNQLDEQNVSVDWFDLPVLTKLESLHLLTEWQFRNPVRLRTLMRSDDELATWRHEPIGYDSKRNAYWLIGGDRLWIQRVPPKPPKAPKSLKRKRPVEKSKVEPAKKVKSNSAKRPRTKASAPKEDDTPKRTGRGRAAKLQAKIKLDAQAKELAALNKQAMLGGRQSTRLSKGSSKPVARSMGTRISARLRGTQSNEWQSIPDDWLNDPSDSGQHDASDDGDTESAPTKKEVKEEAGSDSELTELSDDTDDSDGKAEKTEASDEQVVISGAEENDTAGKIVEVSTADGFIEWETICVTLEEWEHIAERFEKATHYLEKALHKYLINEVVPGITQVLREEERKKRLEDALVHRKRSSRIAIKESEREEARVARQRKAEEDEKMSRARRLEARRQREEEERLRREQAREQRRKEREARELRRKAEVEHEKDSSHDESGAETKNSAPPNPPEPLRMTQKGEKPQATRQRAKPSLNGAGSKAIRTRDWELDCEICRKRGVNVDDRSPMMSCGKCFKWQHIACHDQADEKAGRAKRNWDVVEFICQQCRSRMFATAEQANATFVDSRYGSLPRTVNLATPYSGSIPYHSHSPHGYGAPYVPQSSSISSLYHAANSGYTHYNHPYGDIRNPVTLDRYPTTSQSYIPTQTYNQPPSTISFSHYQPREGGFTTSVKSQSPYQARQLEVHDQHPQSVQPSLYSDLRSSSNQRSNVPPPAQSVWSLGTSSASNYTTPYHNVAHSNGTPRRDLQQPSMKSGPSSPPGDFNQHPYSNAQFRYHSTT